MQRIDAIARKMTNFMQSIANYSPTTRDGKCERVRPSPALDCFTLGSHLPFFSSYETPTHLMN